MESPKLARRIRTSLILILIWALTLFIASLPKVWVFKQLPIYVGWPAAAYACWSLRSYSKAAKAATVAVCTAALLSLVRGLMPLQTLYSMDGTTPEISIPLLVATLSLTVVRDCATIVAMIFLGRLVSEIANPVDVEPEESLVQKAKTQFRWLTIGWVIAIIWAFAIAIAFALAPMRYAELMNGLPNVLRRLALSGHAIIKIFLSWNIVLVTYSLISRWHAIAEGLREEFESGAGGS